MRNIIKLITICTALALTSCVSMKEYNDLKADYEAMRKKSNDLFDENQKQGVQLTELQAKYNQQSEALADLQKQYDQTELDFRQAKLELTRLQNDYDELNDRYISNLSGKNKENAALLKELQSTKEDLVKRESDLAEKEKNLATLTLAIQEKQQKVDELQNLLAKKDKELNELKNKMLQALVGFKDKGLSVEIKDGKVYVSMAEKLLFASGKWDVSAQGKAAIAEVAEVIANHSDLDILVEGHTDNVPMRGNGDVKDNLDLSVIRATSIAKILLQNNKINPLRVTASGRGEFMPLVPNTSAENKAKNRRAEIILSPKISDIYNILN